MSEETESHHALSMSNWPAWLVCGLYKGRERSSEQAERGSAIHKTAELLIVERNKRIKRTGKKKAVEPPQPQTEEEFDL